MIARPGPPGLLAPALAVVPIAEAPDHVAVFDPITGCELRVMTVSPALAAHWLASYNTANRSKRDRLVGAYSHDMKSGQWQFTGDPVRFGVDGLLYDGQHRLESIERSGQAQRLLVIRGLLPSARGAIDGGATRRIGDDLRLDGYTNVRLSTLAAIATRAIYWEMGIRLPQSTNARQLTRLEKINYIRSHPELEHAVRRGAQIQKATSRRLSPSVSGFVFWLALDVDESDAYTFFEDIELAANWKKNLVQNHPVKALLRRVKDSTLTPADQLYLLLKAWVLFRSDRPSERLNLPRHRLQGRAMSGELIPDPATVLPPLRPGAPDVDLDAELARLGGADVADDLADDGVEADLADDGDATDLLSGLPTTERGR
jgi:hypothetical protein